ncbi:MULTISPECIES: hypothetical protein [unclassified Oceanispirochaeta]|uniref:hypothetical protein n=1 Tax=unclassified Oceanispirochaeta TaxID=2635722 RepID=UPI000E098322|nr:MULTISPECIES: hypothetical protein [unclassified Oceanispirochaeta]MBF9015788.1 hypothetical protein [Oceanispirochaeta sp. M2]NPD72251.1 hypothetical protein [Oceanispirochaeta sp. M1]RDG32347.1 hypothetical protein DV872_09080 [Oceanispirochaeta sp. M1]
MRKIFHIIMIIFLTSLLCACFMYDERVYDNPYDPDRNTGSYIVPEYTVSIDGDTSDWADIPLAVVDGSNEESSAGYSMIGGGDINEVKLAQDAENLYMYMSVHENYPMEQEGIHVHWNFNEEDDSMNHQLVSLSHNSDKTIGIWGNAGDTGYDDSPIRFTGLNASDNAIELAVAKSAYWDILSENHRLDFGVDTWYQGYEDSSGDGGLDGFDLNENLYVILKDSLETAPVTNASILNFPTGTAVVDGVMDVAENWDTAFWYRDFTGDDTGTQNNCDIENIYIMQDSDRVYFFITFTDPALYSQQTGYRIELQQNQGVNHTFYTEHSGAAWVIDWVDYNATQYSVGTSVAGDGSGVGIEMEFEKHPAWNDLTTGPISIRIISTDGGSNEWDSVSFSGSYKAEGDAAPTVF